MWALIFPSISAIFCEFSFSTVSSIILRLSVTSFRPPCDSAAPPILSLSDAKFSSNAFFAAFSPFDASSILSMPGRLKNHPSR